MFNLGSDDKDELQENMKEIKDMIQREDRGSQTSEDLGDTQQGFETGQNPQSLEQQRQNQNRGTTGRGRKQETRSQTPQQDTGKGSRLESGPRKDAGQSLQDTREASPSPGNRQNLDQGKEESEKTQQDSRREVIRSEPKKDKKSSSGSESDEPLFLKEEEFRDVREMVEEMSYLSQEMQDNLDKMKKSIKKERENTKNIDELVNAYGQRRSEIESLIETGQK